MQLSAYTMQVLKNFASINPNVVINPGSTLMTMAEAKNIIASATIPEKFTQTFGIYDLSEFLNVLNLVDQPTLTFDEKSVAVSDQSGRAKIKYFFSDPDILTKPAKAITMPSADVTITLDQETLNNVKRAASVLGHDEMSIVGSGNNISISVVDTDNSTSNVYNIDVAGTSTLESFNFIINISNLKMIPGDYKVEISKKLISQFTRVDDQIDLCYWVALEKSSSFK